MTIVLEGQLQIDVEKRIYTLRAGEGICICDGATHYYHKSNADTRGLIVKFTLEPLERVFDAQQIAGIYGHTFKLIQNQRLRDIAQTMLSPGMGEHDRHIRYAKLVELTAILLAEPWRTSEISSSAFSPGRRYMRAAQSYMVENSRRELTLNMLADHLGLTRNYCSKYIREQTGTSFIAFLNQLRVSDAECLLVYGDMSMTDIAEQTGFGSIQTFNRVFKKNVGVSPREYRKSQKRVYIAEK